MGDGKGHESVINLTSPSGGKFITMGEEKVQESIVRLNREGITSTAESSSEAATGELESPKSEGYATAGYDFKECIGPSESTSNDLYKMILSVQTSQNTWSKNWTTSSAFTTKPTKWRSRFHLSKKRIATFKPENHSRTEEPCKSVSISRSCKATTSD